MMQSTLSSGRVRSALLLLALLAGACNGGPGQGTVDGATLAPPDADDPDTLAPDAGVDAGEEEDTATVDTTSPEDVASPPDTSPLPDSGGPEVTPPAGYPGADLVVRIVEPDGHGAAAWTGSVVRVSGVLFGEADTLAWRLGDQTGDISVGTFWGSGPIGLEPGDNTITVTATRGERTVTDSLVVTFNPAFRFDDRLAARPSVLWVGEPTDVVFTIQNALYGNADPATLRLWRADAAGALLAEVDALADDGALATSGDEILGDRVFTRRTAVTCASAAPLYFRAAVAVRNGASTYTALSPTLRVDCLTRVTTEACVADQAIIAAAAQLLAAGVSADDVVADLVGHTDVRAAGRAEGDGQSIWLQFHDGLLGAVLNAAPGDRGAGARGAGFAGAGPTALTSASTIELGSKRAIVLAPFAPELGASDDGDAVAAAILGAACASYDLAYGEALVGASASLAHFRDLSSYGVASVSTHGDALFGGVAVADMRERYQWRHLGPQEVLWTGTAVTCSRLVQAQTPCSVTPANPAGSCPGGARCVVTAGSSSGAAVGTGVCLDDDQVDLRLGRAVLTDRGYAVTPSFFSAHRGSGYPSSLVNLGACRTMYNGTLATALYAAGARAITGFSGVVDSAWARQQVLALFAGFGVGLIGQRYAAAEDPHHPGTWWRLFGATNLDTADGGLINGDFETRDASGWTTDGDARVLARFETASPTSGKFMGLVSTGLGYSVTSGGLEQRFCIPADVDRIELDWKFYSQEFLEFCGTQYQDTFRAELVGANGVAVAVIVDVHIDDLCGYEDGSCDSCPQPAPCALDCMAQDGCQQPAGGAACTGSYGCECGRYYTGLTAAHFGGLEGEGTFGTRWQHTVRDVSALAGTGPVTLRLFATDKGDSVFDTAVLIDAIRLR